MWWFLVQKEGVVRRKYTKDDEEVDRIVGKEPQASYTNLHDEPSQEEIELISTATATLFAQNALLLRIPRREGGYSAGLTQSAAR